VLLSQIRLLALLPKRALVEGSRRFLGLASMKLKAPLGGCLVSTSANFPANFVQPSANF
jgi:hypothetical protein